MVRVIVLLLGMLTTAGAASTEFSHDLTDTEMYYLEVQTLDRTQLRGKYDAWNLLCFELRNDSCIGIPVPKVVAFAPISYRPGLLGFYRGGDTIYVRSNIRGGQLLEVLAHEMSHYMDTFTHGLEVPGAAEPICFSEMRAWSVSDNYNILYGRKALVVGSDWVDWYAHCKPFKDAMYPNG